MRSTNKTLALLLTLLITTPCLTILTVKPANAETIPKPSAPEFTMALVDHSYNMPPVTTSSVNPYNNKTVTSTAPGYRVYNLTIDLTIKNQAFPSVINGNATHLFFDVQTRGHYGGEWTDAYHYTYSSNVLPVQSNSEYTVVSLPANNYQKGDEIDIQVRAIVGYTVEYPPVAHPPSNQYTYSREFFKSESDWSDIQTIKIGEETQVSPTPSVPELSWLAIAPLLVSVLAAAVLLKHRKTPNTNQ